MVVVGYDGSFRKLGKDAEEARKRDFEYFQAEEEKFERWADDVKDSLETELKEIACEVPIKGKPAIIRRDLPATQSSVEVQSIRVSNLTAYCSSMICTATQ